MGGSFTTAAFSARGWMPRRLRASLMPVPVATAAFATCATGAVSSLHANGKPASDVWSADMLWRLGLLGHSYSVQNAETGQRSHSCAVPWLLHAP